MEYLIEKKRLLNFEINLAQGFRLTFLGYDYLALKALSSRGSVR